jgi:molybdopterin-containing oxidoreductase family membrane subunit
MSTHNESIIRQPLVTGENITYAKVTDDILVSVENKPNKAWWIGFTVAA